MPEGCEGGSAVHDEGCAVVEGCGEVCDCEAVLVAVGDDWAGCADGAGLVGVEFGEVLVGGACGVGHPCGVAEGCAGLLAWGVSHWLTLFASVLP